MDYRTKRQVFDELRQFNREVERTCLYAGLSCPEDLPEDLRQEYEANREHMKAIMPRIWGGSLYLSKGMGGVRIR